MTFNLPPAIPGVVELELLAGSRAAADEPPALLVEVPHGADERGHYEALRQRLRGDLPDELELFFNFNTDVGAWAYGRATAAALVAAEPTRSALILRCSIPRTFIDCNRPVVDGEPTPAALSPGALTPGLPSYVRDPGDRELLLALHRRYVAAASEAYALVCGAGGLALVPHSYGPRTVDIDAIDDTIVAKLRRACAPDRRDSWPLRAEVDLLTRDGEGRSFAPPGLEHRLLADFAAAGYSPRANDTYYLHPSSLAHRWSTRHPGQVLCLELRRDLLVEAWTPFDEMRVVPDRCERVAAVLAPALAELGAGPAQGSARTTSQ